MGLLQSVATTKTIKLDVDILSSNEVDVHVYNMFFIIWRIPILFIYETGW